MKTLRISMIGWTLLVIASVVSGCAPAAAPNENIDRMIATAKTASDHEAIAAYYDKEASDAHAKYEEHKASIAYYDSGTPQWRKWARHCARLAQDFKDAEQEASALATEHRLTAQDINSGGVVPTAPAASGPSAKQKQ